MTLRTRCACAFTFITFSTAAPSRGAELVDLAPPGIGTTTWGRQVNNAGVALVETPPINGQYLRAPDGTFTPVNVPPGATRVHIERINNLGAGAGFADVDDVGRAVVREPSGSYTFIPVPGANRSAAMALSDNGNVAGTRFGSSPGFDEAFIYRPGSGVTLINSPTQARAVNNSGVVAGQSGNRGFKWTAAGGTVILPVAIGDYAEVTDMNEAGTVVGVSGGGGSSVRAVKWNPDNTVTVLPADSGFSVAFAINTAGDIAGESWPAGPQAYVWPAGGGFINLNELLTPAQRQNWDLQFARDINDHGQVVGWGKFDPDGPGGPALGSTRAFMITIPEPSTAAGALASMAGLLAARRRR